MARDLSKVKLYIYSDDVNEDFNCKCVTSKYERKNESYKLQDRKKKKNTKRRLCEC